MACILSVFSYFTNILHFNYLQTDEVPAELCFKMFLPAVKITNK